MAGDYTRLTFDPLRDRAMVLEQQGRVHLDADFNELAALLERRLRVETRDIVGPAVVPATEPDSFKIAISGTGVVTIGRGRMYVDGLIAENHGSGTAQIEPVWDEPRFAQDTPYLAQPYVGKPLTAGGVTTAQYLLYLDVWQRELTYVEDPTVLEAALDVDTATRIQTAWRVRRLTLTDAEADARCADDWDAHAGWVAATRPSAGRLSSKATKVKQPEDPCAVAHADGYRGLENRLYRVEIHDGGGAGTATFKWSRDNGAVAARITAITNPTTQPVITVDSLGRDDVLRFAPNQWVEATNDVRELDGQPGLIGQILETDPTERTITLKASFGGATPLDLTRNPRLRRWDQTAGVNAAGVIPITTSPETFALEDGVEVTLSVAAAGGEFRSGDWWVFAARSVTAKVEELVAAPPRGVRHHYARLAIVVNGAVTDDCRIPWPGECECEGSCECTQCVTPETHQDDGGPLTIQKAIDLTAETGGRVCLGPGLYRLKKPLEITKARSLTLAGAGHKTVLACPDDLGILVQDSIEVSLERFALLAGEGIVLIDKPEALWKPGAVAIALLNTIDSRVQRCYVVAGSEDDGAPTVGIGLGGWAARTRLLENVVYADIAVGDLTPGRAEKGEPKEDGTVRRLVGTGRSADYAASAEYLVTVDMAIEDNFLLGERFGVDFGSSTTAPNGTVAAPTIHGGTTRIARNLVLGGGEAGISLLGLTPSLPEKLPPLSDDLILLMKGFISTGAKLGAVTVADNVLRVFGDGIRAATGRIVIEGNLVSGNGPDDDPPTDGILVSSSLALPGGRARVAGNTVLEFSRAGIFLDVHDATAEVSANRIERVALFGITTSHDPEALPREVRILGNEVVDVGINEAPTDDGGPTMGAIVVRRALAAAVSDNLVRAFARGEVDKGQYYAIRVSGCAHVHVDGNQLLEIGPEAQHGGQLWGILATYVAQLDVRGNTVHTARGAGQSQVIALEITVGSGPTDPKAVIEAEDALDRAWLERKLIDGATTTSVALAREGKAFAEASVHGNTLYGPGPDSVALIRGSLDVIFADNRCVNYDRADRPVVLVEAMGPAIASANRVTGGEQGGMVLVSDGGGTLQATVLGNITEAPIVLNAGSLVGTPWEFLNIVV